MGDILREIKTKKELLTRLESYYLFDEISCSNSFKKKMEFARNYIEYKQLKRQKLTTAQIARRLSLMYHTVRSWNEQIPPLMRTASQIPSLKLSSNLKLLNLSMQGQWEYNDFIKVPIKINNYRDILYVLNQLKSLENKNVRNWKKKFGLINKEQAFGYILGLMISDADKDKGSMVSSRIRIGLSKVYDWNKNIGEALCYCLSIIGLLQSIFLNTFKCLTMVQFKL